MDTLQKYSDQFFDDLEVYDDLVRGASSKVYLRSAVQEFLEKPSKQSAFAVYDAFFDSYRIKLNDEANRFLDLLDMLRSYEEHAAVLIDRQRDHYIHSVNVFVLGLSIYIRNIHFREYFSAVNLDKKAYPGSYDTKHEEFFYRWGIASLFHDVGYPVEIIGKQLGKFIGFAAGVNENINVKTQLDMGTFEELNTVSEILPREEFVGAYRKKFASTGSLELLKPIDLLAHKLHLSLGVDLKSVKSSLEQFTQVMAEYGFIDHGYFSAVIVLRWYGFLIQRCRYQPAYFFYPILDSASAILLHNYYRNVLMKPPFKLNTLDPQDHPIAYLLILCDELQEWSRQSYGILDHPWIAIEENSLKLNQESLEIRYSLGEGEQGESFADQKLEALRSLLDLNSCFPKGFSISSRNVPGRITQADGFGNHDLVPTPRPLLEHLEKLAAGIHEMYNQKQLELHPGLPLKYPTFSDLPDSLKYSNLRQARGIGKKIRQMGMEIRRLNVGSTDKPRNRIQEIPGVLVERMAQVEHEEWMEERLSSGWVYGSEKNLDSKRSPYLVAYSDLQEENKELDRDAIRSIPTLLHSVGLGLYRRGQTTLPIQDGS